MALISRRLLLWAAGSGLAYNCGRMITDTPLWAEMRDQAVRTAAEMAVSRRRGLTGDMTITTFNVWNLLEVSAESSPLALQSQTIHLTKLALAVRLELALPAILILQEVGSQRLLQALADRVNVAVGAAYAALLLPTSDRRGIHPGFMWDQSRVTLRQAHQLDGPAVAAAFGPDSPYPCREPLAGHFSVQGRALTILANHFKSDYVGEIEDEAAREHLLRQSHNQRLAQARVVRDWANAWLVADPDAWLLVAGDLNTTWCRLDAPCGDCPLCILEGQGDEPPLTNLLRRRADPATYTFVRETGAVVLDHILVSPALLSQVAGVDVLHFNAGLGDIWRDDPTTVLRASDHDPLEARFAFQA